MNSRRRFVLASTALAGIGVLPRAAVPQSKTISVPSVDSVAVRVLVDSSYDTPRAPASKLVRVRRSPFMSSANYRKVLHNEWGLALALESRMGADTRNLLLDYGYTPETYLGNMEVIGVDPAKAQALILSHGHFDHFGGLVDFSRRTAAGCPPISRSTSAARTTSATARQAAARPATSATGACWIGASSKRSKSRL